MRKDYMFLKSGTDVRGVALEGVEGQNVVLTDEVVYDIVCAFVKWVSKRYDKKCSDLCLAVGNDSRLSADRIRASVIKAFCGCGVRAYNCSLSSTPAMFMTTVHLGCDAAVQITASHHPFNRNGLKFFTKEGSIESEDLTEILQIAQSEDFENLSGGGVVKEYDFMSKYCEILRDKIKSEVAAEDYEHPLKGKKIMVDAGNGAGGFYAEKVLKPLGADVSASQFLEPDGSFPNHIPNPEDKYAMECACRAVRESSADFGVIFDTDVDRAGAVDRNGNEINRNRLIALSAAIALKGEKDGYIVTDSVTSDGLKKFIEENLSAHHYRYKRGYRNVINKAIELEKQGKFCPLAIETSGHAALKENYFLDDGAYLVTKFIIEMASLAKQGKEIEDLILGLEEPKESTEIRIDILCEDFKACGDSVIKSLQSKGESDSAWKLADDSREGIRVSFSEPDKDGWFLLRQSVHDPVLPVNIESNTVGGVNEIAKLLFENLKNFDELDLSVFSDYLK